MESGGDLVSDLSSGPCEYDDAGLKRQLKNMNAVISRRMEPAEQRIQRLELQRLRAAKSRICETQAQRQSRLKANRERITKIRQSETEEQRELRLKKQRERLRELRKIAKDTERKKYRQKEQQILLENRNEKTVEIENRIQELSNMRKKVKKQKKMIKIIVDHTLFGRHVSGLTNKPEISQNTVIKSGNVMEEDTPIKYEPVETVPNSSVQVCISTPLCGKCGGACIDTFSLDNNVTDNLIQNCEKNIQSAETTSSENSENGADS